jgi:hypothetical protein
MAKGKKTGGRNWKVGESGNPNGAPPKEHTFKNILMRLLEQDYIDKDGNILGNTKELLCKAWIEHAFKGRSIAHLRELLDRIEGKVPQPIQELNDEPIDLNELRNFYLELNEQD